MSPVLNLNMNMCLVGSPARGRRWRAALLALIANCLCWAFTASATTFSTALDPESINVGETATLSLTFEGGGPQGTPSLPDITGLHIAYVGPSSQFSFVNGQTTSTITHHFTVTADRPGVYTIPALSIAIDGTTYTSDALKLTVTQPGAPNDAAINSGTQIAFAKLALPRKQLYVGETTTAELQIWLRDDIINYGNLQIPNVAADGFNVGKMGERQPHRVQRGNRVYTVIPIVITITAIKSGTLTLGPIGPQMVIVLPGDNQGGDPLFRFFNQGQQKEVTLNTDAETVQSLKLPANAPPGFTGAIGQFHMTATEGPTTISAGDPITIHVRIAGNGALDSITLPDFSAWNGFKTYPPSAKTDYTDQQDLAGVKTFEQIVTPQNAEVKEIPAFSFSYFDPDSRAYRTLTQPAQAITVRSVGAAPVPSIAAAKATTPDNAPAAQSDILPVKQELGTLVSTRAPWLVQPGFLALQSLPVLAFLAALVWRQRADNLANNPRLLRRRAVAQLVQTGLVDLRKHAAENNSEQFFATLFRLLQEQLGERLDCPASAITESVVDEPSVALKASPATLARLRELFQMCNQARYAPVRDPQELAAVAGKFETVTRELQSLKA
jgi:hypothetical protein